MTAKDLKNALLQEAVQGKLVPQIASEGNARDLLEEIVKEKAKLIKEGKLKKEKPLPEITEDEILFDIPENWCWCRLGEVFQTCSGTTPQSKNPEYYNNGTIYWVRTTDLNNGVLSTAEIKITDKAFSDCNLSIIPKNSVCLALYGGAGTIGKNAILNFETTINQSVCAILPNKLCEMKFVLYFLQYQRPNWMDYASGSRKDPNINQIIVKNCLFPLPPLEEQKRIVTAIEQFIPLIEEYGKKEAELTALNADIAKTLKNAILQEAVQGKLAPQIASEGNAKDLLEEIKAEKTKLIKEGKIKKEKPLPEITEDEIPFDIPENWCWCKLGEICNEIKRGKSPKYADRSSYLAFAQKCNVKTGGIDLGLALYLDESSISRYSEADNLIQEDIVINSTGGGTMGRVGLYETKVPNGIKGVYPDSHVTVIRSIGGINQRYLYYVLKHNQPTLEKSGAGSTNQTELKPATLTNFVIPLPSVKEQKRIITTIEKLLPLCEQFGE